MNKEHRAKTFKDHTLEDKQQYKDHLLLGRELKKIEYQKKYNFSKGMYGVGRQDNSLMD